MLQAHALYRVDDLYVRIGNDFARARIDGQIDPGQLPMNCSSEADEELSQVLNFAASCGVEGEIFLALWRAGNWEGVRSEFPSFDLGRLAAFRNRDKAKHRSLTVVDEKPTTHRLGRH